MNGSHGDMEGIDSSFGWYLKYVRNHFRQFFHFRIGIENRNVPQINPSLISRFRVALVTLINDELGHKKRHNLVDEHPTILESTVGLLPHVNHGSHASLCSR